MKRLLWLGLLCLPLSVSAADLYRWVGPDGVVHYSDGLPPADARQAGRMTVSPDATSNTAPQAKPAVVLYASACGPLCDNAIAWLADRGIAYTLKNPQSEPDAATELQKMIDSLEVPVLKVGEAHFKGFDPVHWGKLLSDAGYSITPVKTGKK